MADLPLIPLSNRALIAVGGDDRITFLQGLVTNDVTNLEGKAVWSALLTAHQIRHTWFPAEGVHNYAMWRQHVIDFMPRLFRVQ